MVRPKKVRDPNWRKKKLGEPIASEERRWARRRATLEKFEVLRAEGGQNHGMSLLTMTSLPLGNGFFGDHLIKDLNSHPSASLLEQMGNSPSWRSTG